MQAVHKIAEAMQLLGLVPPHRPWASAQGSQPQPAGTAAAAAAAAAAATAAVADDSSDACGQASQAAPEQPQQQQQQQQEQAQHEPEQQQQQQQIIKQKQASDDSWRTLLRVLPQPQEPRPIGWAIDVGEWLHYQVLFGA
jgi:hypothetical protein